jgi:hypothetical protein
MIPNREQWFLDRIGKRVFRNKTSCNCDICKDVYEKGLIISDEMHANYLYTCECEYTAEGSPLRYFDTIQERDEFERNLR